MPLPNQSSNSLRYLKARLRILKRPMVWGSASALILAVLLFAEYWNHSDWFSLPAANGDRSSSSGVASLDSLPGSPDNLPSQEDSAIGADIDSLPILLNGGQALDAEQSGQARPDSNRNNQQTPTASSTPGSTQPPGSNQNPLASRNNPFLGNSQQGNRAFDLNLPTFNPSNGGANPSDSAAATTGLASGIDLLATPGQPIPMATTPLQTNLENAAASNNNSAGTGDRAQTQSDTALTPTDTRLAPGQLLPTQRLSTSPTQSPVPLQMSPPLGTTGYTLPPTLRNVPSSAPGASSSSYSNPTGYQAYPGLQAPQIAPTLPNQTRYGQSNVQTPGFNGNLPTGVTPYGAAQPNQNAAPRVEYVEPEPLPFTAPYSRGGGEFNTFSNP
jgi:hypothetical protein